MSESNKVYIILKACELRSVESAVGALVSLIKHHKVKMTGPIPLPCKRMLFTVNRSVHIDKHSREQFFHIEYTRLICVEATSTVIEAVSQMRLPAGVMVKIKMNNARKNAGFKRRVVDDKVRKGLG